MTWLVNHFLIGAGIGLLLCTALQVSLWRTFWVAVGCGSWACLPDVYHVLWLLDVSNPGIPHPHDWPPYDLFFFHYTLDQGYFQERDLAVFAHAVVFVALTSILYGIRTGDQLRDGRLAIDTGTQRQRDD